MVDLVVNDIPDELVERLERRASENGRSAADEHRAILEAVIKPELADFWKSSKALRDESRDMQLTPSVDLLREIRDGA